MVPVREIAERLGIQVQWDAKSQSITASKDSTSLVLRLGSIQAEGSSGTVELTQAPYLDNERVYVPLRALAERFGFQVRWNDALQSLSIQALGAELPSAGSADQLAELLKNSEQYVPMSGIRVIPASAVEDSAKVAVQEQSSAAAAPTQKSNAADSSYSATNVQVEGVDEADVVKTDGSYLYQVNREKVVIAQAVPAGEMKIVSTLAFPDQSLQPLELYVDDKHLVVIGQSYSSGRGMPAIEKGDSKAMIIRPYDRQSVKAVIYDLTNKSSIKKLREVELEGNYVSSRKIGSSLYLIANKWINTPYLLEQDKDKQQQAAPAYRDSADGEAFKSLPYDQIRYFPDAVVPNYLVIGGLDLSTPNGQLQVTSYVGSGDNVYASENNLYVAMRAYHANDRAQDSTAMKKMAVNPNVNVNTSIYKFKLDSGMVQSVANGKVPGTILNQFSMDEHKGSFRIATTTGDMWRTDENTSKNNVYILDASMNVSGKLEGLAPGERIYSTRFMGDRAYMVTFKKVDPLFVLDLHDPAAPQMLGKLKIPGYSDYLHPYDEMHLIGFGKDAVEATNEWDPKGSTTAFYQGLKIAMFDVTDVANPVEMFKESIGDRGTDSELLRNHKALLFSKEKNLLAFPVSVAENNNNQSSDVKKYGQFIFQGMYVYNLSLTSGFQLKGKITHLSKQDIDKAGGGWYESKLNIQRGLYIGNVLYTLSQGKIKANELNSLGDIAEINIP